MSPPLCARCGAVLPDPMARAVVTCLGCGAKSEARTQATDSDAERVLREAWERDHAIVDGVVVERPQAWRDGHAAGVAEERARWEAKSAEGIAEGLGVAMVIALREGQTFADSAGYTVAGREALANVYMAICDARRKVQDAAEPPHR